MTHAEQVERYLQLRETLRELDDNYKAAVAPIKEEMETIETEFLNEMNRSGLTSMATPLGTAFKKKVERVVAEDWDAFYAYIKDNGRLDLLERRPAKLTILDTLESEPIPGVRVDTGYTVNIRKA